MDPQVSNTEGQKASITERIRVFFANGFREEIKLLFKNSIPLVSLAVNV